MTKDSDMEAVVSALVTIINEIFERRAQRARAARWREYVKLVYPSSTSIDEAATHADRLAEEEEARFGDPPSDVPPATEKN